jgi:transcriptional regulator with XRE-family HTH domain
MTSIKYTKVYKNCLKTILGGFMNRLKELRKEKGLTQIELSQLSGIPQNQISRFEKGMKMNEDYIIMLAKTFKVSTDYFLGLTNKK